MDKVFKTYDEQIALLVSRGVEINTSVERSEAKKVLQHYGYYNLVNGYKMPFLEINNELSDDKYKDGTKIKEIVALYDFDTCIRRSFFKYILLKYKKFNCIFIFAGASAGKLLSLYKL